MSKRNPKEIIENEMETDDEIEIKPRKEVIEKAKPQIEKKKYNLTKEFVFTDARKESMSKALKVKKENAEMRRLERRKTKRVFTWERKIKPNQRGETKKKTRKWY